jgi:hypothetical protein
MFLSGVIESSLYLILSNFLFQLVYYGLPRIWTSLSSLVDYVLPVDASLRISYYLYVTLVGRHT